MCNFNSVILVVIGLSTQPVVDPLVAPIWPLSSGPKDQPGLNEPYMLFLLFSRPSEVQLSVILLHFKSIILRFVEKTQG